MSELGALPAGWTQVAFGELLREPLRNGHSAKASDNGSGVPTLTLSAVTYNRFTPDNIKLTVADPAKVQDLWLEPDDLLVERSNTPELVGTTALFSGPRGFAIFPDLIIRARLRRELNIRYIALFMKSERARRHFRNRAQGIAGTMPKIDQGAVEALLVPLPPRAAQDRIVAAIEQHLSDVDAGKAALKRALANLKHYRAAVLKAACEGRLVSTEAELARKEGRTYEPADVLLQRILAERRARWETDQKSQAVNVDRQPAERFPQLPEGWTLSTPDALALPEAGAICAGPFGTIFKAHDFRDEGIPIIFLRHVKAGRYMTEKPGFMDRAKWEELFRPYSVFGGELLVTKLGDPPGECAIYPEGLGPAMVTPDVIKMSVDDRAIDRRFLVYYLNSERARQVAFGVAFGTTRLRMTLPLFRTLPVPVPPLAEQHRIVAEVDRLLSVADETEQLIRAQLTRAERLRQSVLKRAFEGKLVPQDPNDEPASALLARIRAESAAPEAKPARARKPRRRPAEPETEA